MPRYLAVVGLAVVFAIILAIGQGFYWTYVSRKQQDREELARRLGTLSHEEASSLFQEKGKDVLAGALGGMGKNLERMLAAAESNTTVTGLLFQMLGGFFIGTPVALVITFIMGAPALLSPILGFLIALLPYLLVRRQANVRTYRMLEQLPDSLDLMSRSLQAGLGLADAFRLCAEELPLPVAAEFGRVFEEIRFGRDFREALGNLVKRNPNIFELRMFVSSVLLQRETGGNLIEILNTISATIRNRFLFDAKLRALTAETKFSSIILGSLPFFVATMVSLVNPDYLSVLFTDPIGNVLVFAFFFMYGVGITIMNKIATVEA